jgi:hypothetical protein
MTIDNRKGERRDARGFKEAGGKNEKEEEKDGGWKRQGE